MTLSRGVSNTTPDPLIEDKSAAINKQVELLKTNFKEEVEFSFDFLRANYEIDKVNRLEPTEQRFAKTRAIINIQYEKYTVNNAGSYYHCKVKLSPLRALALLNHYNIALEFSASRTFRGKDFPRKSNDPELPPEGICSYFNNLPDPDTDQRVLGKKISVQFSYQFDIRTKYYLPGDWANKDDYVAVRKGIWHEIMECTILAIAAEALYMPKDLYYSYHGEGDIPSSRTSFAQTAVVNAQRRAIEPRREKLFLHWPGDPPFSLEEARARSYESDAEASEHWAKSNEGLIWGEAANKWSQAQDGWNRASDAWRQVAEHPGREEKICEARLKSEEARKRKLEAERKARPWWEIRQAGHGEVGVEYGCWPHNFRAEVRDAANTFVERIDQPHMDGKFSWGAGRKPGLYLIKADIDYVKPNIQKIVLY